MAQAFKQLTMSEFKNLSRGEKLQYIEEAIAQKTEESPPPLFKPEPFKPDPGGKKRRSATT